MRFPTREALKAVEEFLVDGLGTELVDELVVVDCHLGRTRGREEEREELAVCGCGGRAFARAIIAPRKEERAPTHLLALDNSSLNVPRRDNLRPTRFRLARVRLLLRIELDRRRSFRLQPRIPAAQ